MIKEQELISEVTASLDDGVTHRICTCRENEALCGADVTDEDMIEFDEHSDLPECVKCVRMTPYWICPVCLYRWDEEEEE